MITEPEKQKCFDEMKYKKMKASTLTSIPWILSIFHRPRYFMLCFNLWICFYVLCQINLCQRIAFETKLLFHYTLIQKFSFSFEKDQYWPNTVTLKPIFLLFCCMEFSVHKNSFYCCALYSVLNTMNSIHWILLKILFPEEHILEYKW